VGIDVGLDGNVGFGVVEVGEFVGDLVVSVVDDAVGDMVGDLVGDIVGDLVVDRLHVPITSHASFQ